VDDWYKAEGHRLMQRHAGPAVRMSDSEVLTVALAGHWRVGVPWQSERGVVRYMQQHQAITGWLVGPAALDDRWMMQGLVSARSGQMMLVAPPSSHRPQHPSASQPPHQVGPAIAANSGQPWPYLADRGFNGARWQIHWGHWQTVVMSQPPENAPAPWTEPLKRVVRSRRQVFGCLVQSAAWPP